MALLNLSYTIGTSASPILEPIGVRNIFLIAAVFQMLVIVVLPFCTSWKDRYKELECTQCGYRLTGLEPDARCPECGHARQRTA